MSTTHRLPQHAGEGPSSPFGPGGAPRRASAGGLEGRSVLLVEDEVFIAFDLQHALESVGAMVTHARTLAQAMAAAEAGHYDAAVLDVTLSANETCRPVADALRRVGTPFLLHSGDLDRQGEVIASLAAPLVPKPSPPDEVIRGLVRLLEGPGQARH